MHPLRGGNGEPLDVLELKGISACGFHGLLPEERASGQAFVADVSLHLNTSAAAETDSIEHSVDYAKVCQDVTRVIGGKPYNLLETLAQAIAGVVLTNPSVEVADVALHKPWAPIGVPVDDVVLRVRRQRRGRHVVEDPPGPEALDYQLFEGEPAPPGQVDPGPAPTLVRAEDQEAAAGPHLTGNWGQQPDGTAPAPARPSRATATWETRPAKWSYSSKWRRWEAEPAQASNQPSTRPPWLAFHPHLPVGQAAPPGPWTPQVPPEQVVSEPSTLIPSTWSQPVEPDGPSDVPPLEAPNVTVGPPPAESLVDTTTMAPAEPLARTLAEDPAQPPAMTQAQANFDWALVDSLDQRPSEPVDAIVALGANVGDALATLRSAIDALRALNGLWVVGISPLARTAPVGAEDQPEFFNAVVHVRTDLSARSLFRLLALIEDAHGRVRHQEWGPRTLDLDLIAYDCLIAGDDELTVPHPRAHQRAFVLLPWAYMYRRAFLPGVDGGMVAALAAKAPDRAGVRWLATDWINTDQVVTGGYNQFGTGDQTAFAAWGAWAS